MAAAEAAAASLNCIFLMGPTGVGKTALALALARHLAVEIISVDSALVYRGLDIGSAKPSPILRQQVAHHLIDTCDPGASYSAAQFRVDALQCIEEIHGRGRLPLLVGGTGLYFRALEQGLSELPCADPAVRAALQRELAQHGNAYMHAELAGVDAEAAARIHPNDPQRLLRALEVYRVSGRTLSALWRASSGDAAALRPFKFVLAPQRRAALHSALAARFDDMLERGFVNEVQVLRRRPDLGPDRPALRAVGYREIWRYLDGELGFEQMRERGVIASRQLAKRQLTWLRRERDCLWFEGSVDDALAQLLPRLASVPGSARWMRPAGGTNSSRA